MYQFETPRLEQSNTQSVTVNTHLVHELSARMVSLSGKSGSQDPMARRTRILLLLSHLGGGGAEHVIALLARGLSQKKYEVHLGLVGQSDRKRRTLPAWVHVHPLGAGRARSAALPSTAPDMAASARDCAHGGGGGQFLVLMLRPLFPANTSVLVRQNATATSVMAFGRFPRLTRLLYRALYRNSDQVICQSRDMARDLTRAAMIGEEQITVLPNPVDLAGVRAALHEPATKSSTGRQLLAVGRLSREKGFDLLLHALAAVRERFPHVKLILVGSGQEEQVLKSLCRRLGLEDAVGFAGHVDPPYAFFARTTLFVLPSRHEGMPNALLEAAAAGLPIVATPASGGVVDLLRGRPGAWLAPEISAEALAATMIAALERLRPGKRFAQSFFASSSETYSGRCCGKRARRSSSSESEIGTKVIHHPRFPVEIYSLTFFPNRCFLSIQFQYSFSTPWVGKRYQGHLALSRELCSDEDELGVPGHRILGLYLLRASPEFRRARIPPKQFKSCRYDSRAR